MSKSIFILQGNIVYSKSPQELEICRRGYAVCQDGYVKGVYQTLPFRLGGNPITDYGDCLIIPGLVDLHVHASQYAVRGTGMDRELLEWLETTPFPEEAKFADPEYAQKAYQIFVEDLKKKSGDESLHFRDRTQGNGASAYGSAGKERSGYFCRKGKYGPELSGLSAGGHRAVCS